MLRRGPGSRRSTTRTASDRLLATFCLILVACGLRLDTIAGTTTQKAFTGAIDEVAIYDRALTKPELDTRYASGAGCPPP
jgi:hypothetical protein